MTKLIDLIMDNAAIEEIKADLYDNLHVNNYINYSQSWIGNTALHIACCKENEYSIEYIKLLLAHPQIDVNNQNLNGVTALHMATICKGVNIVKLLLAHPKIDVNIRAFNSKRTALDFAKEDGSIEIIKLLEKASNYLMFNGKKYKLVEEN